MAQEWFYAREGQKTGPVSAKLLRELAVSADLRPDDLVWLEGMPECRKAGTLQGLFPVASAVERPKSPPLPTYSPSLPQVATSTVAGLDRSEPASKTRGRWNGVLGLVSILVVCGMIQRGYVWLSGPKDNSQDGAEEKLGSPERQAGPNLSQSSQSGPPTGSSTPQQGQSGSLDTEAARNARLFVTQLPSSAANSRFAGTAMQVRGEWDEAGGTDPYYVYVRHPLEPISKTVISVDRTFPSDEQDERWRNPYGVGEVQKLREAPTNLDCSIGRMHARRSKRFKDLDF